MDQLPSGEADEAPRRRSKRGAVMIFLLGWIFLPLFAVVLGELEPPWFQVGCAALLAFIAAFVVAMRGWSEASD
jgi:hypothetical protein